MSKKRNSIRLAVSLTVIILAVAMAASACLLLAKDTSGGAAVSGIVLSDRDINTNMEQYLNSSVMYKLPDTVKDTDMISVIVQTSKASLLDAYEGTDKTVPFSEYVTTGEADAVSDAIISEKGDILATLDKSGIDYSLGADYKAIFGGFELEITARDFEALCKSVGDRATVIVGDKYLPAETELVENSVNVYGTGIFDSSSFGYSGEVSFCFISG